MGIKIKINTEEQTPGFADGILKYGIQYYRVEGLRDKIRSSADAE